jgi:succinate dehydrogenase / fumarate reductase flavoprotein subunit
MADRLPLPHILAAEIFRCGCCPQTRFFNQVDACELIIHSSLERKESRGPFFRGDFPATDNKNWLVANVLKKSGNGLRFEQRPYDLPFFVPGFETKDNLEVAW